MKFKRYSLHTVSKLLFTCLAGTLPTYACGPYFDCIPTPCFFASVSHLPTDKEKQENLRLWQQLTSQRIPLSDIEQAVYADSYEQTQRLCWNQQLPQNLFYRYLHNTNDQESFQFLLLAKKLQAQRAHMNSPWYYPAAKGQPLETEALDQLFKTCQAYNGVRLKDRYALQAIRALFVSRQYAACVTYYQEHLQPYPDNNLFKRMAQRYVAGCWMRLGDTDKANAFFVQSDDLASITADDPVAYMATYHPDSPALLSHIQASATDSAFMCRIAPLALQVLAGNKARNKGDWAFLLAYIAQEFQHRPTQAQSYLNQARKLRFSSADLRDHARAYQMLLRADRGDKQQLLTDLRWMETKVNRFSPHSHEWIRLLQHIVFAHWLPVLVKQQDYTTAILLTGYAERQAPQPPSPFIHNADQGALTFQLMGSLTSSQLAAVQTDLNVAHPLWDFLKRYARTDADYFNELIGTLALREEKYERAVQYLSRVRPIYQTSLNIYRDGYLARNPFVNYPSRWQKHTWSEGTYEYETSQQGYAPLLASAWNAKLRFARQMQALQHTKETTLNPDRRALAEIDYAMGVRNSFEECWALTQYWRGTCMSRMYPSLNDWGETYAPLDFLYTYNHHAEVEAAYQQRIEKALQALTSDEARAEAQLKLNHLRIVIIKYGHTTVATRIKQSCDRWHDWL